MYRQHFQQENVGHDGTNSHAISMCRRLLLLSVDLCNAAAGKLQYGRPPLIGDIRGDQDRSSAACGLGEGIGYARDLISSHLPAVGIRKMAVRYEHRQLAECRVD